MSRLAKIVQFHEPGEAEVLRIVESPLPEPGPGEVRLRVKAIGLNRSEIMFRKNEYFIAPILPSKNGYEASGIVEAIGSGVDSALLGTVRSTVPSFHLSTYGVYGEVAIVPASALAIYPDNLSYLEGTSIWMAYLTAYGALVQRGGLSKGDYVVITAASSSVGLAGIQITKAAGGIVIATTRTNRKKSELLAAGADHVVITDEEDVALRILEITNGLGANIVFDSVAGLGVLALAKATAKNAIIIIYGTLSPDVTPFPVFEAWSKGAELKPFSVVGYVLLETTQNEKKFAEAKQYIFSKLKSGELVPRIDRIFRLEQIAEAHRYMETGSQIGKIVISLE